MGFEHPPKWTGNLVGKMHVNKVKSSDLAKELGVTEGYISMLLNARRETKGAKERLENAYKAVLEKRAAATENRKDTRNDISQHETD